MSSHWIQVCDLDHVHSQSGISACQSNHTSGTLLRMPWELFRIDEHHLEYLPRLEWIIGNDPMDIVQSDRSV